MSFFKLIDLTSFYFTPQQYADVSYQIIDLYNAGYSVSQLYQSGYSLQQISSFQINNANVFTSVDLLNSDIPVTGTPDPTNNLKQIMNIQTYPLAPIINYYTNPTNLITMDLNYAIQKIFQIYNIVDLFNAGFTLQFMAQQKIPIATVYPLVNGDFNSYRKPNAFLSLYSLKQAGYTLSDILSLSSYPNSNIPITIAVIYESLNYSISDFYNSGYTASQLANAGIVTRNTQLTPINPATLYAAGYTFQNIYSGGYIAEDYINAGITINQLIQNGLTVQQINSLGYSNITINDLVTKYGATLSQLLTAGFTLPQISPYRIQYYSIGQFLTAGFTIQDLDFIGGFTPMDLYTGYIQNGNPTISQILNLGYDASYLIPLDIPISKYYDSSYSSLNLFNNGFYLSLLAANTPGYSLVNFKNDGVPIYSIYASALYNISQFLNIGYQVADFYNGNVPITFTELGFSLQQVIDIGYNLNEIAVTHYYPASDFYSLNYPPSVISSYYSIEELLAGGYSRYDLNIVGTNIKQYCCSKLGVLYAKPSILGSSSNQTGISKKKAYSQSINNRIGGSYTATYSIFTTNTTNPTTPVVCVNPYASTNIPVGTSKCKAFNISSKSAVSFSYFIRNYIISQAKLYLNNPNPSTIDIENTLNGISELQFSNPDAPIYSVIQNYFDPSIPIISGPF